MPCYAFCGSGAGTNSSGALVADVCDDLLRYSDWVKVVDVIAKARVDDGYDVMYSQAHRALAKIQESSADESSASYEMIALWLHGT